MKNDTGKNLCYLNSVIQSLLPILPKPCGDGPFCRAMRRLQQEFHRTKAEEEKSIDEVAKFRDSGARGDGKKSWSKGKKKKKGKGDSAADDGADDGLDDGIEEAALCCFISFAIHTE